MLGAACNRQMRGVSPLGGRWTDSGGVLPCNHLVKLLRGQQALPRASGAPLMR